MRIVPKICSGNDSGEEILVFIPLPSYYGRNCHPHDCREGRNMFETDRLLLRAYKESDMDKVIENMSHYEVQIRDSYGFVAPRTPGFREQCHEIVRTTVLK